MIGDETQPGEIAFDVSSQPEHNTPGASDEDAASLSGDDVSSIAVAVSSNADDVSSNADDVSSDAEAVSSDAGVVSSNVEAVLSNVESLVDDLEGLVFSDKHEADEEEEL
jgi:methyl-accepting chemotaxis protein